jgi:hypothetical protein
VKEPAIGGHYRIGHGKARVIEVNEMPVLSRLLDSRAKSGANAACGEPDRTIRRGERTPILLFDVEGSATVAGFVQIDKLCVLSC